jgi:hypothetical protein
LDVALLSYAHDVLSDRGGDVGGTPVKFTDKFSIGCWFVSLVLAIVVVFSGTIFTIVQTWAIFLDVADSMGAEPIMPFVQRSRGDVSTGRESQRSSRLLVTEDNDAGPLQSHSPSVSAESQDSTSTDKKLVQLIDIDTQIVITLVAAVFSSMVTPSLVSLVVGMLVFVWAEQPRLASISATAFIGVISLLAVTGVIGLIWLMVRRFWGYGDDYEYGESVRST